MYEEDEEHQQQHHHHPTTKSPRDSRLCVLHTDTNPSLTVYMYVPFECMLQGPVRLGTDGCSCRVSADVTQQKSHNSCDVSMTTRGLLSFMSVRHHVYGETET